MVLADLAGAADRGHLRRRGVGGKAHPVTRDDPTQITEMCPACGKSHRGPTMRCPNYQKPVPRPNTSSVPVVMPVFVPKTWWTRFREWGTPKPPRTPQEALQQAANRLGGF
jgi:hypothetical protein